MAKYRIVEKNTGVWPYIVYDIEKYYETSSTGCDGEKRKAGWQIMPKTPFEAHRYASFEEAGIALKTMKETVTRVEKDIVMMEEEF